MKTVTVQPGRMEDVFHRYEPYLQQCRHTIVTGLKTTPTASVLAGYFEGGKMLRALLVFLAASVIGHNPKRMIMAAAALELLHGASLIHDDIVDQAYERRGRPALHIQVGTGPALVLGDYLILRSFAALREAEVVYGPDRVVEALHSLNHYAQSCCLGEVSELTSVPHLGSEQEYLAIEQGKTGSQFAAAATLPVILAGGTPADIEALQAYGLNLGISFQIQDDILDLTWDAETLGKPVGNSLLNARPMLPLIYLRCYGSMAARRAYQRMQVMGEHDHVELVTVLKEEGIWERVRATQERYLYSAMQSLDRLRPSDDVMAMKALALYATTRHSVPLQAELKAGRE